MKLLNNVKTRLQRGQGMTEYLIILALVAIVCILLAKFYGTELAAWWQAIIDALFGNRKPPTPPTNG